MNHLKQSEKVSPVGKLVMIGVSLGIVVLITLACLHVPIMSASYWLAPVELIGFIGLVCTINWEKLNQSLSKTAVIWGIVWLAALTVPWVYDVVRGLVASMNSHNA